MIKLVFFYKEREENILFIEMTLHFNKLLEFTLMGTPASDAAESAIVLSSDANNSSAPPTECIALI